MEPKADLFAELGRLKKQRNELEMQIEEVKEKIAEIKEEIKQKLDRSYSVDEGD
jgi:predicted  nucleic acid-binding Zn-ribbon protein